MPSPIFHYTILAKNRLDFPAGSLYLSLFFILLTAPILPL